MSFYNIKCPICNNNHKVGQNTGYKCTKCDTFILIGNYGNIKRYKPNKKYVKTC